MKIGTVILLTVAGAFSAKYPGSEWAAHSWSGWSEPMLKAVREFTRVRQTSAVMIVQGGRRLAESRGSGTPEPVATLRTYHFADVFWGCGDFRRGAP